MTTGTGVLPSWAPALDPSRWVDNRVYVDPRVFEREIERIFDRSWLFVAHESEVAATGDYLTTAVAGQPVLVARGKDGALRAFLNTCRHRGSKVVSEPCGHAAAFRCPYHFWVYSLEGELVGIPDEEAYDGSGFAKAENPLGPVRCETVLGLVFIAFDDGIRPLREWLGSDIIRVLETPLANAQFVVAKHRAYDMPINWKLLAENVRDGYHVPFVHPFFRKASPPGDYTLYANGHANQVLGMDPNGIDPGVWARISKDTLPGVRLGEGYIVTLFPDTAIQLRSNEISIDSQRVLTASSVVFESRILGLAGDALDVRENRLLGHETWVGNPLELEDGPIFLSQQAGVTARSARYSIIARGKDATTGKRGDDNRLRQWWTRWREMMGVQLNSLSAELD
jgi:phenylpropionate dioxygenase-like ring-hydroxylating dioxygenase large terminal subunit